MFTEFAGKVAQGHGRFQW